MADTGYGNALNVERTVRLLERAGASAIQLEDQDFPKRCGHLDGKTLIAAPDMVGKIKAAADSRHADDTLIIALTDAADPRPRRRASRRRRSPSKASSAPSRAPRSIAKPAPTCCSSRRRASGRRQSRAPAIRSPASTGVLPPSTMLAISGVALPISAPMRPSSAR
jgi:hypothetical protein